MIETFAYVIVHGLNWVFADGVSSTWITKDDEIRRTLTERNDQEFRVTPVDGRVVASVDAGAFTHVASREVAR